jgi:hypothetical protein
MPKAREIKWKDLGEVASAEAQERCTMRPARSAERSVRFPSSLMAPGRFIAKIAIRNTGLPGRQEGTKAGTITLVDTPAIKSKIFDLDAGHIFESPAMFHTTFYNYIAQRDANFSISPVKN